MDFHFHPLRFWFVARETIHFPQGKASNILRGAFGTIFRRLACDPKCPGAKECGQRERCAYARVFEPGALADASRGYGDWPRAFVFRAAAIDGRTIRPDETFHFDLNLFDVRTPAASFFELAFAEVSRDGLGPSRGRAELIRVEGSPTRISLDPAEPVARVRVRFVTPTELKAGGELAARPEFGVLLTRIRDRLSKLRELYGEGPLEMDFRALAERAAAVRMTLCDIRHVGVWRKSSRTGAAHPLGGFVGEAGYEGDLGEFVPFLRAAKWTGVGRQTAWGKGELDVHVDS